MTIQETMTRPIEAVNKDPISAFIDHMRDAECAPDAALQITADDKMHRFRLDGDKPKIENGSYILRVDADGFAVGGCMNFRDGIWHKWHIKAARKTTDAERAEWKARADAARKAQDQARADEAAAAAIKASEIWKAADHTGSNAYLTRKGFTAEALGCRISRGSVVVPMWSGGKITGLQFIDDDGGKLFLKSSAKEGAYHAIKGEGDLLVIGEGLATMGAIHASIGCSMIVAFDAGNLKPVAQAMRKKYPDKRIVIAADGDQWTIPASKRPVDWDNPPGDDPRWQEWREAGLCVNTGADKAAQAAIAIGGALVLAPPIPATDAAKRTDWWDYWRDAGGDAVKAVFDAAMAPRDDVPDYGDDDGWEPDYEAMAGNNYRHNDQDLIRDDKDRPIWNMANAVTLLENHKDWQGVLAFNKFTVRREVLAKIPGQRGGEFPRALDDDDYTAAQQWFNRNGFPRASSEIVGAALRKVCRNRSYDPLTDYLDGLKWDGKPRVKNWLENYTGAESSAYVQEAGKRWLISAVARAYRPGCKADHMLVLEGKQGARKSSALAALTGEEWFSDSLPPMNTKDASSYLRGRWIVEVGELEAMRREVDAVKAFLTRQVEHFRPAYGREEVTEARRCIFAGTTNKDDWQKDETGGRRFWPVKVGTIDIEGIGRDRNQIWAEAVTMFKAGEIWWLEGEVAETAKAEAADRRADDPWRPDIAAAVEGLREVSTKQILNTLNIVSTDMTPQLSKRVAQELVALGWQNAGRFTTGERKGAARYTPPN